MRALSAGLLRLLMAASGGCAGSPEATMAGGVEIR